MGDNQSSCLDLIQKSTGLGLREAVITNKCQLLVRNIPCVRPGIDTVSL